jgi:hypothetical protein
MMKIEGSWSISQMHGSAYPDPDPRQNVMDPQHWLRDIYENTTFKTCPTEILQFFLLQERISNLVNLSIFIQRLERGMGNKLPTHSILNSSKQWACTELKYDWQPVGQQTEPMRLKARELVQHDGPPGWPEESNPAGYNFVHDGRSMPPALTDHSPCAGLGLLSCVWKFQLRLLLLVYY